jgi:hypothetical protein
MTIIFTIVIVVTIIMMFYAYDETIRQERNEQHQQ